MTIKECIDNVDNIKPNQYSVKDKVQWLSFIDEIIINDVLRTHEGYDGRYDDFSGYSEDRLSETLIVASPYDRLYTAYLKMKIDGENGETARYNNSASLFNSYMMEFRKHYNKTHMPLDVTGKRNKTMPPKKTSASLSDAEFENLKRELYAILREDFAEATSQDKLYGIVTSYVMNNAEMLKGRDGEQGLPGPQGESGKDGADGKDGQDGITPHIGENGNWFIGDTDTGKLSRGEDGQDLTEEQLSNINDIPNKADISYVDGEVRRAESIAKGRATGYVFDTVEKMNEWLAIGENKSKLVMGDNLYIRTTTVPDYWWDATFQMVFPLETQKVDLDEYVQKEDGYGLCNIKRLTVADFGNIVTHDTLMQDGTVSGMTLYTKNGVDNLIGDIETALDNIIAKYGLGGDAV